MPLELVLSFITHGFVFVSCVKANVEFGKELVTIIELLLRSLIFSEFFVNTEIFSSFSSASKEIVLVCLCYYLLFIQCVAFTNKEIKSSKINLRLIKKNKSNLIMKKIPTIYTNFNKIQYLFKFKCQNVSI